MNVYEAAKTRRSIRKFTDDDVTEGDLIRIVECARVAPYGGNLQPLKFMMIKGTRTRRLMYPMIKYAGYLPDWNPTFEETPKAFIAIVNDTSIKPTEKAECDSGAAGMSMCLAATEMKLGSIWLGAIDREGIKKVLHLEDKYDVMYLIGFGYPAQTGTTFEIVNNNVKYYHDEFGDVHVPKRTITEVLL